jgi:hypothetical protein
MSPKHSMKTRTLIPLMHWSHEVIETMSAQSVILKRVSMIAEQQRKSLAPLADDLPLSGSGLDSLCLAIIVANLDDARGPNPLSTDEHVAFPVTLPGWEGCDNPGRGRLSSHPVLTRGDPPSR